MAIPADMAARHCAILTRLSELGMALACDLQERALAAEDETAKTRLSAMFHRVARSVRQTLALESRLERDRQRAAREDRAEAIQDDRARIGHRRAQVRAAVERNLWNEYEYGDVEGEVLLDDLDVRLDDEILFDGFTDEPLDAHIVRLCQELGLSPPLLGEGDREAVEGAPAPSWPDST